MYEIIIIIVSHGAPLYYNAAVIGSTTQLISTPLHRLWHK